jgi:hypothetical protein
VDPESRARLQIRAVMVVVRHERARGTADESLHWRALDRLDEARAELDGQEAWHADVLAEFEAARAEVEAGKP